MALLVEKKKRGRVADLSPIIGSRGTQGKGEGRGGAAHRAWLHRFVAGEMTDWGKKKKTDRTSRRRLFLGGPGICEKRKRKEGTRRLSLAVREKEGFVGGQFAVQRGGQRDLPQGRRRRLFRSPCERPTHVDKGGGRRLGSRESQPKKGDESRGGAALYFVPPNKEREKKKGARR